MEGDETKTAELEVFREKKKTEGEELSKIYKDISALKEECRETVQENNPERTIRLEELGDKFKDKGIAPKSPKESLLNKKMI